MINFRFDGKAYIAQEGDTLAVAELAPPIHLVQTALSRAVIGFSPTALW